MTTINPNKPTIRQTALEVKGAPLVVALHPRVMAIRRKGTQEWFALTYDAVYDLALKIDARQRQGGTVPG